MKGPGLYVGITDEDWYTFLRARPHLDEVNFWAPSGAKTAAPEGTPFLFKRHKPGQIGGFGYVQYSEPMSVRAAWEFYGERNGVGSLAELLRRIERYANSVVNDTYTIGCTLLATPVFFQNDIAAPANWSDHIQRTKTYSFADPVGADLWHRATTASMPARPSGISMDPFGGFSVPALTPRRLGQGTFRKFVLNAYGNQCAVTGEHTIPVLQASHIVPFAETGHHEITNGLSLRSDIHRLFDLGYVTVTPDFEFRVSHKLNDDFSNGKIYYEKQGSRIHLPDRKEMQPNREYLERHS
jgi:putative restriction endonuclease